MTFARLKSAILKTADLQNAKLFNARLIGANLRGANLVNADLNLSDLSGAILTGADLSFSELDHAIISRPGDTFRGKDIHSWVEHHDLVVEDSFEEKWIIEKMNLKKGGEDKELKGGEDKELNAIFRIRKREQSNTSDEGKASN